MRLLIACSVVTMAMSAAARAEEWVCSNKSAEISCDALACDVTMPDGFTPMELTVNSGGAVSLCAYSGCWSGQAAGMLRVGHYLTAIGLRLDWSGLSGSPGDLVASIDTKANIATVLSGSFAHPMTCTGK